MSLVPWRVRNFLAQNFPLAYHLAVAPRRVHSADYWDERLAASWDSPVRNRPGKNRLVESLTSPDDRILDVGCGNGGLLRHLKERGYGKLHGLEHSAYACRRLSAEGLAMTNGSLLDMASQNTATGGEPFEVVIASQVLEHVIRRDRFLREIKAVLGPAGRVLLFVPNNRLNPLSEPEHVAVYTAKTLTRFLRRHFTEVAVSPIDDEGAPVLFAQAQGAR